MIACIPITNNQSDGEMFNEGQNYPTVLARNLYKSYDKKGIAILNNLCMTVEKGTIYGLLGSSGCGKTTLLSCIVGLGKWDSGDLEVFGKSPGTKDSGIPGKIIGYMPQELALYQQLSVIESIQLFGRLYNMTSKELSKQWTYLADLLKLPADFKLISDLSKMNVGLLNYSGGQQRRVSLALALIHSPELLILDEPTVGLDPLLRKNIWEHLYKIVKTRGTTILATTHYIEEARCANTIGVMRSGCLLVEDTPQNLVEMFQCELLEQVVLQLCRNDDSKTRTKTTYLNSRKIKFHVPSKLGAKKVNEDGWGTNGTYRPSAIPSIPTHLEVNMKTPRANLEGLFEKLRHSSFFKSCQRTYALTTVFLLTYLRFPAFLVMLLFMPSIQGSISILALSSKPRGLNLGIVNHDVANWSVVCDMNNNTDNLCDLSALSCKCLDQLKTNDLIELSSYSSEDDALTQVHLGNAWGYLVFDQNYSQNFLHLLFERQFASNETIVGSRIHAHLDHSEFIKAFFLKKHLLYSLVEYFKELAISCDIGGQQVELPQQFRQPVYGSYDDNFTAFIMPGVLLCSLLLIGCIPTGITFISDRNQGRLGRATAAGLTPVDLVVSHLITAGIVTFGQLVIWNLILHFSFGFVVSGSLFLWIIVCLFTGLLGGALGFFFGILCRDVVEIVIVGVFLYLLFVLFGGAFTPVEEIPWYWRQFGYYAIPTPLPILSLRSIVTRGVGFFHPMVWPGVCVLVCWIVALCVLSAVILTAFSRK